MSCLVQYRNGHSLFVQFVAYRGDKIVVKVDGRIWVLPARDLIYMQ